MTYIVRTKPMTDLCWECQRNNLALYRTANLPDSLKSEKLQKQEQHLVVVHQERSLYNNMVHDSKKVAEERNISNLEKHEPCSNEFTMHYSFDYAQQVHYPSDPLQPGPMYFLVPRKCGIFGVCCEALPQQINYLIDEGMCGSKGSNAVISYLHHFFSTWALGETEVHLHCDNCSGQNKNKFMLWYFLWRVLHGLHTNVHVHFMISGHTKFSPDWCFGLLKQRFRRTPVSTLADIEEVVNLSTVTGVNKPQLIGSEDGTVFVPTYDWQSFLEPYFKPLAGIKSLHHFHFSQASPGVVFYSVTPTSEEKSMMLLKNCDRFPSSDGPQELKPPGLPLSRQWYLFQKIREFVRDDAQDITCPKPSSGEESQITNEHDEFVENVPPQKLARQKRPNPASEKQTKPPTRSKRGRK